MKNLIKLNKNEQQPMCVLCVYHTAGSGAEGIVFCKKKKKLLSETEKCRKFALDITALGVRRKRAPKTLDPNEFSLD